MIALRECADRVEAETIRIRLAAANIQACITGTDHATALSFGGAATRRMVRVEVAAEDYEYAAKLLADDELRAQQVGAWVCSRCSEPNEAPFDLCWSCSKTRSDDDPSGLRDQQPDSPTVEPLGDSISVPPVALMPEDQNPYRPVLLTETSRPRWQEPARIPSAATEDSVSRALRAAAIGTLLLPPLLNFYSIYLLSSVHLDAYRQKEYRWRLLFAWTINLLMIPIAILFWLPLFH